jgi:endonuclease/exonuclease/phosphatase family metal-dependent hydrolase
MDTYSGNYLYVFNTHLDHRGKKSRLEAAKLIKSKIAEYVKDDAVILLGDFNSEPNDEPYKFFTNTDQKLFDTHTNTQHFEGEEPFTYYGFDISANEGKRLDYVFVNDKMKILNYEIIVDNDGNFYFSDHLPVLVRLKFL